MTKLTLFIMFVMIIATSLVAYWLMRKIDSYYSKKEETQ